MITKHADKLPYQTHNASEKLEEDNELAGEYEIYEEKKDGSVEHVTTVRGKNEQKFVVNPATEIKRTEEMEETQLLQHAMTTALIDVEGDVSNYKQGPSSPFEKKQIAFKVITSNAKQNNDPSDADAKSDNIANQQPQ